MTSSSTGGLADTLRALILLSKIDRELRERPSSDATNVAEARRDALARLPNDVATIYRSLTKAGRYPVVTPLADGFCSACHLRIPAQLANAVTRANQVICCPHCRRILCDPRELATPHG